LLLTGLIKLKLYTPSLYSKLYIPFQIFLLNYRYLLRPNYTAIDIQLIEVHTGGDYVAIIVSAKKIVDNQVKYNVYLRIVKDRFRDRLSNRRGIAEIPQLL